MNRFEGTRVRDDDDDDDSRGEAGADWGEPPGLRLHLFSH